MSNVGVDVIRMLTESCELYCSGRTAWFSLVFDSLLFMLMAWLHSLIVMSIAMVWYMSMESEKTILAFMIISNFGEIKTTVFKRFDTKKLFILCRMDIIERVNLFIAALFIVVEDLGQVGVWTMNRDILINCGAILILESVVDIIKHSVVVNFNSVRPGIYREYLKDICQSHLEYGEQGSVEKLVFEPIGPTILLSRVVFSALTVGSRSQRVQLPCLLVFLLLLSAAKLLIGWCLHLGTVWYVRYFESRYGEGRNASKNIKQS